MLVLMACMSLSAYVRACVCVCAFDGIHGHVCVQVRACACVYVSMRRGCTQLLATAGAASNHGADLLLVCMCLRAKGVHTAAGNRRSSSKPWG